MQMQICRVVFSDVSAVGPVMYTKTRAVCGVCCTHVQVLCTSQAGAVLR